MHEYYVADDNDEPIMYCRCPLNYAGDNCEIYLGFELGCSNSPCVNPANNQTETLGCDDMVWDKETNKIVKTESLWFKNDPAYYDACIDYECYSTYECRCEGGRYPYGPWTGQHCETWFGEPRCSEQMATFEDHQTCIDDLYSEIEKIVKGDFTWQMRQKIRKLIKKFKKLEKNNSNE